MESAFTEVCHFIDVLGEEYKAKIPKEFYSYLKSHQDTSYKVNFDANTPIEKIKISREATILLSMLHLKFWANESDAKYLKEQYSINEKKYRNTINQYKDSNWLNQNNVMLHDDIKEENNSEHNNRSYNKTKNSNINSHTNTNDNSTNELKTNWIVSYQEHFSLFEKFKRLILKIFGKYHF